MTNSKRSPRSSALQEIKDRLTCIAAAANAGAYERLSVMDALVAIDRMRDEISQAMGDLVDDDVTKAADAASNPPDAIPASPNPHWYTGDVW